ncbi:hypothetical protein A5888_003235 [Enterococcus sp. 9E7_DIV0242]|uniref:Uncharacterized protein n=2 Tax=Candidatus Enterococcus clewellii TaxID=1834193 RepID=A0A242JZ74_9ENTE|nr:hypothetical protein A5888_003820 [Enterococcus sp. 9E7_DIV0242]
MTLYTIDIYLRKIGEPMKKLVLTLVTLGVIGALAYGGYSMVMKFMHKEVYGIILADSDAGKLDSLAQQHKTDINQVTAVTGKWVASTKTLALTKDQAEQLLKQKALKSVTEKNEEYQFTALQQIDGELPILYSKDATSTITDAVGKAYEINANRYVVLGESSGGVANILILEPADYDGFVGDALTVQALDQKIDASKALADYTSAEIVQMYDLKK